MDTTQIEKVQKNLNICQFHYEQIYDFAVSLNSMEVFILSPFCVK